MRLQPLVLLVDDLEDQRDLYRQYLSYAGFDVETADDGTSAVETALTSRPDVIVMDLAMPGLDGFQATQRLKSHGSTSGIPVIALTAHGELPMEWALAAGCTSFLRKPCYPDQLADEIRGALVGAPAEVKPAVPSPLVLLVDDYEDDRDIYSQYLAFHGCRVLTARNGRDAIASALRVQPDVIVMDLAMPSLDGWEATRKLKGYPLTARIPVIALSCHDLPVHRRAARQAGCSTYLTKPCLPEALLAEIRRVTTPPADA